MRTGDTIVAIAGAPGRSARGLVRWSGPDAFDIADTLLGGPLPRRRGIVRARWSGALPCLVLLHPSPHGYTGEDGVELQAPGNPDLLARVQDSVIRAGARAAEPGEFTARAFFNGKLTITQAEGVAATIAAATDAQWRAARLLSGGALGETARSWADRLARGLALVEAGIDFVDQEDVVPIAPVELEARLAGLIDEIEKTLARAAGAERINAVPRVVLAGPPNAGKSTLFNALLGRERAVVSDVSGTTRDVLAEPMRLDPDDPVSPEVILIDLAGADESTRGLNPLMQAAAARAIDEADLILRLHAPDAPDARVFDASRTLDVHTKADLVATGDAGPEELRVSAATGEGLDELRRAIAARVGDLTGSLAGDALALLPRHEQVFREALRRLHAASDLLAARSEAERLEDVELIAAELRLALDALGQVSGEVTPDEVLGHIFAGFCVGK